MSDDKPKGKKRKDAGKPAGPALGDAAPNAANENGAPDEGARESTESAASESAASESAASESAASEAAASEAAASESAASESAASEAAASESAPAEDASASDASAGAPAKTPASDLAGQETLGLDEAPRDASPRLKSIIESLLFAADKALNLRQLGDLVGEKDLGAVRAAVEAIEAAYAERGMQLHHVAGGFQFRTNAVNAEWVQKLLAQKPVRLTRAQLETLAICAYRQPITRPEIDEIRGVDSGGTLKTLMERSLVRILGKKEEPGRPMLYGTTREFLEFFNLGDLKDLPTLREFHELSEEHQAQVAALAEAAPAGSIEAPGEGEGEAELTVRHEKRVLVELEAEPEDLRELEEIDHLIRTAGASIATDQDLTEEEVGTATREFTGPRGSGDAHFDPETEPTRLHRSTIPRPIVDDIDGELGRSPATGRRRRFEDDAAVEFNAPSLTTKTPVPGQDEEFTGEPSTGRRIRPDDALEEFSMSQTTARRRAITADEFDKSKTTANRQRPKELDESDPPEEDES